MKPGHTDVNVDLRRSLFCKNKYHASWERAVTIVNCYRNNDNLFWSCGNTHIALNGGLLAILSNISHLFYGDCLRHVFQRPRVRFVQIFWSYEIVRKFSNMFDRLIAKNVFQTCHTYFLKNLIITTKGRFFLVPVPLITGTDS